MPRVKRGKSHLKKRRSLLKRVKGFRHGKKNLIKQAKTADMRAGMHAYRDRRVKKRTMRGVWTIRLNAAVRELGMSYSDFMGALKKNEVGLDRKVLSQLAVKEPKAFEKLVESAKK